MKKLESELQKLKEKYPPMPDACYQGLMDAARSVKEEEKMKRFTFRTVLAAALILALTVAVALAAGQLGLKDMLGDSGYYAMPDSAEQALTDTEKKQFEVGPLSVTLVETLADGNLIYANTLAAAQTPAVLYTWSGDAMDSIDAMHAGALGVEGKISYAEAAQQKNLPLYRISSWLEYDAAYCGGEEMTEAVYGENGEVLCVFMAMTDPEALPEAVNAVLTVRVEECDPATGEPLEDRKWQIQEEITIPVHGVTAEKHYTWEGEGRLEGCTLQAVTARQTCAGVYLTVTLTADESADQDRLYDQLVFADENGVPFPAGISFTGKMDAERWPEMTMERMLGIDLPETMKIMNRDTGSEILLK